MLSPLYPLLFSPVLKNYIWGGRGLEKHLGRTLPDTGTIAESWEIAGHPDGTTMVANGPLKGTLLTDLLEQYGVDLIGSRSQWALERGKFPLLIKILDAHRPLSVQVHPNDEYALENEGNELGKTEMWVILHAEPGAEVILGVAEGTTAADFRRGVEKGKLDPFLHRIPVKTGDHINVPAGSLHAIMDGLLIAEIQQNSNTTYRVYDWNRVGADGRPRQLHVDQALDVINFEQQAPHGSAILGKDIKNGVTFERLNKTPYFTVERVTIPPGVAYQGCCDGSTFEIWGTIAGNARLTCESGSVDLPTVQFALLPAVVGDFTVTPTNDSGQPASCLRVFV